MFKFDEVEKVYRGPLAAILPALIGLGGSVYAANSAADAQKDAENEARKAREKAEAERRRLAMADKPEELKAKIDFGSGKDTQAGTVDDFLVQRQGIADTGLGLGVGGQTAGLGFAV